MAVTKSGNEERSLIEDLPGLIRRGKKEAERILKGSEKPVKGLLFSEELVYPNRSTNCLNGSETAGKFAINGESHFNRLIQGDNLRVMQALLAGDHDSGLTAMRGKIDLIYIDPPFGSKTDYNTRIDLPSSENGQKSSVFELFAYSDTWKSGTRSYLEMIVPRLVLMRELLSDRGSIYVHIDWHVGHYIKIIMDDIFGKENLRNEIMWKRHVMVSSARGGSRNYSRKLDTILFYSKGPKYIFNEQHHRVDELALQEKFPYTEEETGRKFETQPLVLSGNEPRKLSFPGNRTIELPAGRRFAWSQETLDKKLKENPYVIYWTRDGTPRQKKYMDEFEGQPLSNLWDDVLPITSTSGEWLRFPTQKPEDLLKRIISVSSNPGSTVADFFSGSGTTMAVAERMGRNWIGGELGKQACRIARQRLIEKNSRPFLLQSVSKLRGSAGGWQPIRQSDAIRAAMSIYGAKSFPPGNPHSPNLGHIKDRNTLVYVDSPSRKTGKATIRKALNILESYNGSWDRIAVLGWAFENELGRIMEKMNDPRLKVLAISESLIEKMRSAKDYGELSKFWHTGVAPVPDLRHKEVSKKGRDENEYILEIELQSYSLLSLEALRLEPESREKIEHIMLSDPLGLIEYWSVDPEYDGKLFRNRWQSHGNGVAGNNGVRRKVCIRIPGNPGERTVSIRAVDIFGIESTLTRKLL